MYVGFRTSTVNVAHGHLRGRGQDGVDAMSPDKKFRSLALAFQQKDQMLQHQHMRADGANPTSIRPREKL